MHGSGRLVRWLLENDLAESRAFPQGVTLLVYRPSVRPQYATG